MAKEMSVNPVFVKMRNIPDAESNRPSVLEVCLAAERVSGPSSVIGAQCIRGLWRVYPASREARQDLLIKGMKIRDTIIQVANTNPFILRDESGEEKQTTKVWIDNVPISVADAEIEHALVKIGCELRSDIKAERARDADNKLTRFLTGRRFVYITVPATPLDKFLKVSIFTAKLYHKEQKQQSQTTCNNCLEVGHHASMCEKDVVCLACRMSGHKRGDPKCQSVRSESRVRQSDRTTRQDSVTLTDQRGDSERVKETSGDKTEGRGRTSVRQTTLRPTLVIDHPRRHRSETPKRQRSAETSPRSETQGKHARREDFVAGSRQQKEKEVADAGQWG